MEKDIRSKQYLRWGGSLIVIVAGLLGINSAFRQTNDSLEFSDSDTTYQVEIRRTRGGIPHIKAPDFDSLGYGTGYASAEDNICLLAENFLRFRGELSRYQGPDNGNLESDFFHRHLLESGFNDMPVAEELAAIYRGYAAGYNRYLRDTGVANLSDPSCRGAEWVGAISADDVRRIDQTPFYLPMLHPMIVAAKPPSGESPIAAAEDLENAYAALDYLTNPDDKGSNGVALGSEVTEQGRGLLVANPHWDWSGNQRFYPRHQTIPGVLDALGVHTVERPLIGLGTTEHVAWTITVSTGKRMTFFELDLSPEDPTQYLFDGKPRDMKAEPVTVTVRRDDGSLEEKTHTFYSTHFGYVVGQFPWTKDKAFAVTIAHEGGRDVGGGSLDVLRAKSVRELKAVHDQYQYLPANLIAADSSGETLYADSGPAIHVTDKQLKNCTVGPNMVLDGSRSECQWGSDEDAATSGIFGPAKLPFLYRKDYVTNSNDSYWLANPAQPLDGYPEVMGSEGTERTLRTRSGLKMIQKRLDGSDGLGGTKFDIDKMLNLLVSNQNYAGQLLRDEVVMLCEANPAVTLVNNSTVDISEACEVLGAWDLSANLDSQGAHLFREFMREANEGNDRWRWLPVAFNYTVPFDPSAPLETPRGLNTSDNPNVLLALAKAVNKLRKANIALNSRLGNLQSVTRNDERIPLHGGPEMEGIFNKLSADFDGDKGYPEVTGSSSGWMSATEFTDKGPSVKAVLAYSMTTNPESPRYVEQTKMYSQKQWLNIPFREEDVKAASLTTVNLTEGIADCKGDGWELFVEPAFENPEQCQQHFQSLNEKRVVEFRDRSATE